jgi:hypothetical protein
MMSSKGKRTARVIPEASVTKELAQEPSLDRVIQERIGTQLRAMYDDLMQQPVPDRFADLLGKLDKRDEKASR